MQHLKNIDLISTHKSPLSFGDPSKESYSVSPICGIATIGFAIFVLVYLPFAVMPVFDGSNNQIQGIQVGTDVIDGFDFKQPMSYESFKVMPYLVLDWLTFND